MNAIKSWIVGIKEGKRKKNKSALAAIQPQTSIAPLGMSQSRAGCW